MDPAPEKPRSVVSTGTLPPCAHNPPDIDLSREGITPRGHSPVPPARVLTKHGTSMGAEVGAKVAMNQSSVRLLIEALEAQILRVGALGIRPIGLVGVTIGRGLPVLGALLSGYLGVQAFKYGKLAKENGNRKAAQLYFGAGTIDIGIAATCAVGAVMGSGIPFSLSVGVGLGALATTLAVCGAALEAINSRKNLSTQGHHSGR